MIVTLKQCNAALYGCYTTKGGIGPSRSYRAANSEGVSRKSSRAPGATICRMRHNARATYPQDIHN